MSAVIGQGAAGAGRSSASRAPLEQRVQETRARAGVFRLLGRVLEAEMDAALLAEVRGALRAPLAEAGVRLDEAFFDADPGALLEALCEEFTGLFVAPGGVPPYASVFETGRMFQEPADRAERAYRESGLTHVARMSGEFPDHIGTMLGFVAVLLDAEAVALERGDRAGAASLGERRVRFVVEELGRWAPGWCRRARAAALHVFYREMLALAEDVLWSELLDTVDRRRLKELAALNGRAPVKLDYDADFRKASGL